MVLRVPSLIEFGSHCLQTSGCTGGFIEFSMKCCSPNAVKGKQPTSEEPCVTGSCYLEMECLPHSVRAPSSSSGQTQEASVSHLLSQPLALLFPSAHFQSVRKPWRLHSTCYGPSFKVLFCCSGCMSPPLQVLPSPSLNSESYPSCRWHIAGTR